MKRFVLFSAVIAVILVVTTFAAATPAVGDSDNNGEFSLSDVIRIIKTVGATGLAEDELNCYDINGDGIVTLEDALRLIKYCLNGEVPSFCKVSGLKHSGCVWDYVTIGGYDTVVFSNENFDFKMRFKIYVPETYSPHKSYSLVAFLHGLGGESQSTANLSAGSLFNNIIASEYGENTILLLPQCPVDMYWPNHKETLDLAHTLIQYLADHMNIDENRLYITGHSNGSKGVAYMLEKYPNTFAAAVMGSGASPIENYTNLENIATTPIWMFCGDQDSYNFHIHVRALYNALLELGADVQYTEFEGLGHNIFSTVGNTEGLVDWIFSNTLDE